MNFRYARHTTDLKRIEAFYTNIIGLQKLGGFESHNRYDGIFLGYPESQWHLEFTVSRDIPQSKFDEDDLLVFYVFSEIEMATIKRKMEREHIQTEVPKNPYWKDKGIMISDPDGYKIVFAKMDKYLTNADELTTLVKTKQIHTWNELLTVVQQLPYGRNKNREDFSLVLKEQKGTCSSKHALLKKLADLNGIGGVKLVIGMYKMNKFNTPKIGNLLDGSGLEYIPEAHCYLEINNQRIDITATDSGIEQLMNDVLFETEIEPEQVNEFKVQFHRNYLKRWLYEQGIQMSLETVWEIREKCINSLSSN